LIVKFVDSRYPDAIGVQGPYYIKVTPAVCACKYIQWTTSTPTTQTITVNYNENLASHSINIPTVVAASTGATADTPGMRACTSSE